MGNIAISPADMESVQSRMTMAARMDASFDPKTGIMSYDSQYDSEWLQAVDATQSGSMILTPNCIIFPLGGQFLADPGEQNGWTIGPYDDTNSADLGNTAVENLTRLAGGLMYPFDVRLVKMDIRHRNNNNDMQPFGWFFAKQVKNAGSNVVTTTTILNETVENGGIGPHDYSDNQNQHTVIDFTNNPEKVIKAGLTLTMGIDCPTAVETNRYSQIQSGYLHLQII